MLALNFNPCTGKLPSVTSTRNVDKLECDTATIKSITMRDKQGQGTKKKPSSVQKLPVWMTKRLKRKSTETSLSAVESDEQDVSFKCTKTVYIMTEKELKDIALQVVTQAGKELEENAADQENVGNNETN